MEIPFIILCLLAIINIVIAVLFRPNRNNEVSVIFTKIEALQNDVLRIELNLKDDFRINREENSTIAKENRNELNNSLKEFRTEMTNTLKAITDQNQKGAELIKKTLEEKIKDLTNKVDNSYKENRETISANLKDFTLEQRRKFDELKEEQKSLTKNTVEQLDKITIKIEENLKGLTEQFKADNILQRESNTVSFKSFQDAFDKNVQSFNTVLKEKFAVLENKQTELIKSTEAKLELMRETVDEKLQKTLNERLGQSFELVGKQLESVQKGLGEMQTLAQDVGGLKKVLSNVKMRGTIGEVQLAMLLEQVLAPEQYEANVKTKHDSSALVEFAIKLPGRDEDNSVVYLPVDAKFPKDVYEQLQEAYHIADPILVNVATKNMEIVIKKMAKDIRDKYIDPPNTTDFAIMFLPFEGIYAEIVRNSNLLDVLQKEYKVIVTGPTTLAAILNSLQMGFRTLALQKRSSDVWKILGAVKTEFGKFEKLMVSAQNHLHKASSEIDSLVGTRTRAINRRLSDVQALTIADSQLVMPEIAAGEIVDSEEPEEN